MPLGFVFHFLCISILIICVVDGREINGAVISSSGISPRFTNPITLGATDYGTFVHFGSDGFYYFTNTFNQHNNITIIRTRSLVSWENSERLVVLNASAPFEGLWEPELHFIRGDWYIYFAAAITGVSDQRNYVMKSKNPLTPMAEYDRPIKLTSYDADVLARDGTIFEHDDGELYFIWLGLHNETTSGLRLYIAPMFSPTEISGTKVELRKVTKPWDECGTTEDFDTPQVLKRNNRTFITFKGSQEPSSCLGIMGLDYGRHPLVAENWWHKTDGPVFWDNDAQNVHNVNIGVLTTSPDNQESWFLYDANDGLQRSTRAERFSWDSNNFPVFPRPAGLSLSHKQPSISS